MESAGLGPCSFNTDTTIIPQNPLTYNEYERERFKRNDHGNFAFFSGTTVHYKKVPTGPTVSNKTSTPLISVDSCYVQGNSIAVFDGLGGHKDENEKKQIGAVANQSAKYLVNAINAIPAMLCTEKRMVDTVIETGEYIKNDWYPSNYTTPLKHACGVAVRITYNLFFRRFCAQAVGVGDCMAFSWNPYTKNFQQLIPAKQLATSSLINPESITDFDRENYSVTYNSVSLGKGVIVFCVTDGVYEHLPCDPPVQEKIKGFNLSDVCRLVTQLCRRDMTKLLSDFDKSFEDRMGVKASPVDYNSFFMKNVVRNSEKLRRSLPGPHGIVAKLLAVIDEFEDIHKGEHNISSLLKKLTDRPEDLKRVESCMHFLGISAVDVDRVPLEYFKNLLCHYECIGDDATLVAYAPKHCCF